MSRIGLKDMSDNELERLTKTYDGSNITMHIITIDPSPASKTYIKNKVKKLDKAGITCRVHILNQHEYGSNHDVIRFIDSCQKFNRIKPNEFHGVMVQLPLPEKYNEDLIINKIDPAYDVDGLTDGNLIQVYKGVENAILPCTVKGVMDTIQEHYLAKYRLDIRDLTIGVIGRGTTIGRPLIMHLIAQGATVIECNSKSRHKNKLLNGCDIIVSAAGVHGVLSTGAINHVTDTRVNMLGLPPVFLIDVGINFDKDGKMRGDIAHDPNKIEKYLYTPVPGGIGQTTTTNVLYNLLELTRRQNLLKKRIDTK